MGPDSRKHVVIFPFMAHGHALPLVDLSKALSKRGIKVTIITTPSNAKSLSQSTSCYPLISLQEFSFPLIPGLPEGTENTSQLPSMTFLWPFLEATKKLKTQFDILLNTMSDTNELPICVISDFFLGWTLASCEAFGVPRLVFHGMGVLSMAIIKIAWAHVASFGEVDNFQPLLLPGIVLPFVLTGADLPDEINSQMHDNPYNQFLGEQAYAEANSWGVIVNSFNELEENYISALENFYKPNTKAWCVGPLLLYDQTTKNDIFIKTALNQHYDDMTMKWLDKQNKPNSVIYISFGTQADVSDAQLDEVAYGLEDSGVPFLWVVRSETWSLPYDLEKKLNGRCLIIRKWTDQRKILAHRAIGGFLSHCGWNSVLESICVGVPILAWPFIAEQGLNAKFVAEGVEAGIRLNKDNENKVESGGILSKEKICEGVKELMIGDKGEILRDGARALGKISRGAVKEGGSSYDTLSNLINELSGSKK